MSADHQEHSLIKSDLADQADERSVPDLSDLPAIFVLPVHLSADEIQNIEGQLIDASANLANDILEAKIILGAISTSRRAKFELQSRNLRTEQTSSKDHGSLQKHSDVIGDDIQSPVRKRRRLSGEIQDRSSSPATIIGEAVTHASSTEDEYDVPAKPMSQLSVSQISATATAESPNPNRSENGIIAPELFEGNVVVLKLEWLRDSYTSGRREKLQDYVIYEGRPLLSTEIDNTQLVKNEHILSASSPSVMLNQSPCLQEGIFQQAVEKALVETTFKSRRPGYRDKVDDDMRREFRGRSFASSTQQKHPRTSPKSNSLVRLLRETTSEHDEGVQQTLPEMPQWVKENRIYACERSTSHHSPNDDFVDQLKTIRLARELIGDEIGVRAYRTSIASLSAYPYKLSGTREILALPGCDQKIANLFHEYQELGGRLKAVADIEADPALNVMRTFYDIWGVGAKTAREFYYDRKWRDMDDVIEYGWNTLSRVQQIGVKYYDEFKLKIPRPEVEFIASVVTYHAKQIIDDGIECIIVGGYRRLKQGNGDVDLILSHRREEATRHLIGSIVKSLQKSGWITHCLSLHETNSKRDQQPLPVRFDGARGTGFDTLDKALVVWQDPNWPTREEDVARDPKAKNPNVHRRVDIIISPWRTIGCGVAGWTSGTTFQRDLRRYVKHVKGWKFDSSGVRERGTGKWIDLEKWSSEKTRAETWQEAERRVFEGMGLEYREPWERCTG